MVNGRGIGSDEDQRLVIRVLREHIAYRVDCAFMLPDQLGESSFSTTILSHKRLLVVLYGT